MKIAYLHIASIAAAAGLAASAAGFAADNNSVPHYGRDSVTVWNTDVPLSPPTARKSGVVFVGYGRAGGVQPPWPTQSPPRETVQASHVERYGRA